MLRWNPWVYGLFFTLVGYAVGCAAPGLLLAWLLMRHPRVFSLVVGVGLSYLFAAFPLGDLKRGWAMCGPLLVALLLAVVHGRALLYAAGHRPRWPYLTAAPPCIWLACQFVTCSWEWREEVFLLLALALIGAPLGVTVAVAVVTLARALLSHIKKRRTRFQT